MAKDMNDSATLELIPAAKKRGRPVSGNALTNAERQRLFRERKKDRVQIDLSSDDWARLSAILQTLYESDSDHPRQLRYADIVEQVYMSGMRYRNVPMPDWFEKKRYKEPVTVTENQPVQEIVTVTETEVAEDKPVTVTKKPRAKKVLAQAQSQAEEPVTVTEIPETPKAVTVTKNNFPARYAHPAEPLLTWTGRGRKPLWVQEWLSAGGKLEYLEIPTATPLP